jgi:hypothetical protein
MDRWLPPAFLTAVGAIVGVVLSFAAGGVCADGVSESFCGRSFLVWNMTSGAAVALSAVTGAVVGGLLGLIVVFELSRRRSARSGRA